VASEEKKHVGASDKHEKTGNRDIQPITPELARKLWEILWFFFIRINIEQFHRLSQLVEVEIRKRNTNYRMAISPEWDYLFTIRALKIRKDKENILDTIGTSF
jgi:hypothetical protein